MSNRDLEQVILEKDEEIKRLRLWLATIAALDDLDNLDVFINDKYQLCTLDAVSKVAAYARFGLSGAPNIPLSEATLEELCYNDVNFVWDHKDRIVFEDAWQTQSKKP